VGALQTTQVLDQLGTLPGECRQRSYIAGQLYVSTEYLRGVKKRKKRTLLPVGGQMLLGGKEGDLCYFI
jgi:hypothetical protein